MTEPTSPTPPPPPGGGEPPAGSPPPPPAGPTSTPPGGQSTNRGLMIVLSYLWILAVIPLVVEKEDAEVQWHAKHGLVLLVAEIILWAILFVLQIAAAWIWDPLGCGLSIVSVLLWIGVLILHILCIVKGVGGDRFTVPGVSQYADRF